MMQAVVVRVLLPLALVSLVGGCARETGESKASSAPEGKASAYDSGPRAGEAPTDEALASRGEEMFKVKGCSACHAFGQRLSGPDLKGVTLRRTAAWMENQILRPDQMAREDPIARQLMAEHALQMPNQGLSPEEARAVIEYLKHRDDEDADHDDESTDHE